MLQQFANSRPSIWHSLFHACAHCVHVRLNSDFCSVFKRMCTYHIKMQLKLRTFYANGMEVSFDCYCTPILFWQWILQRTIIDLEKIMQGVCTGTWGWHRSPL